MPLYRKKLLNNFRAYAGFSNKLSSSSFHENFWKILFGSSKEFHGTLCQSPDLYRIFPISKLNIPPCKVCQIPCDSNQEKENIDLRRMLKLVWKIHRIHYFYMYIGEKNIFYFFTLLQFVVVATWVF
jgi:hypothetical protein